MASSASMNDQKSHTDVQHLSGFFLFKERQQQIENQLHLGYSYSAKFYKQGEYIRTWRERELFLFKPETRSAKYSSLVYYDPDSQNEKGRINLGEVVIELNLNAKKDFESDSPNSKTIRGEFKNAVAFDITGKVPRDASKKITMIFPYEESKNFLVALYLASAKSNVREFLRKNGELYSDNGELMNLLVTPYEPRLANQFDLLLRSACGCIKCGLSVPKCFGIASHTACCCIEIYLQSGLICERREIIDSKSISVEFSKEELQNMRVTCCNYFFCCSDRSKYHAVYNEHESQEVEDTKSHCLEEVFCFICSRRRGSCLCDMFEIPICEYRSIPCMSVFWKAQHTILCFDSRCAFPTLDKDVPFELGCCALFCYNAFSKDRLADDLVASIGKDIKRERIHDEKVELIKYR